MNEGVFTEEQKAAFKALFGFEPVAVIAVGEAEDEAGDDVVTILWSPDTKPYDSSEPGAQNSEDEFPIVVFAQGNCHESDDNFDYKHKFKLVRGPDGRKREKCLRTRCR